MRSLDEMNNEEYKDFLKRCEKASKIISNGEDTDVVIILRDKNETENGHLYNLASGLSDMKSTISFLRNVLSDLESKEDQ